MGIVSKRTVPSILGILCLVLAMLAIPVSGNSTDTDFSIYNDTFEALNEDLWDRAQYTHNAAQLKNFKLGDLEIAANRLKLTTATQAFSKTVKDRCWNSFNRGRPVPFISPTRRKT